MFINSDDSYMPLDVCVLSKSVLVSVIMIDQNEWDIFFSCALMGFQEVKIKPRPITFAAFSGGSKSCLYKVHQVWFLTLFGVEIPFLSFTNWVECCGVRSMYYVVFVEIDWCFLSALNSLTNAYFLLPVGWREERRAT